MASSAGVLRCHCHIVVVIDGFGFGLCFSFGGFRVISYVHIVVTLSFFFFFFLCDHNISAYAKACNSSSIPYKVTGVASLRQCFPFRLKKKKKKLHLSTRQLTCMSDVQNQKSND